MKLDQLDKRILQHLSEGINSYEELARKCYVSRNTVYRRMATLEKNGITQKTTRVTIDYNKLDITTINIALNVGQENVSEVIARLKACNRIKYLFKTYGTHNIIFMALCEKGKEGETISEIKTITEKFNITEPCISVSFTCEKTDTTPFTQEIELNLQEEQTIEKALIGI
jgi:DNA-binding Lrp family transcriptional regulator